ncbi:MAG TPA: hypothetical protein VIZ22_00120 [Candidatus Limnocylindrales bacterium]
MRASSPRATFAERLGVDRTLLLQLAGLAVAAFLIRLVPMLLTGGVRGFVDYDDGVYMGTALALADGRVVYRDFPMLHPPGIVYVLSPFAALSWLVSDSTAFAAARVGFMVLGGLNTFLVGLVGSRGGRSTALAAAAMYAVWIVAARVERSTWLIAPQTALLLLALLALTYPRSEASPTVTWRKALLVGALLGASCAIQIWGVVVAAVVFVWLLLRVWRQPGGWLRPMVAYALGGIGAVALAFLPFLAAAGEKMVRLVIFDQIGRGAGGPPIPNRIRAMEGLPSGFADLPLGGLIPIVIAVVVVVAVLWLAWRRPVVRLWVALFLAQCGFLLVTPSYFGHYSGWMAAAAALSIGGVAAALIELPGLSVRASRAVGAVYVAGLACLLVVAVWPRLVGFPRPSVPFPSRAVGELIADARCPTSDNPTVLILTNTLQRVLNNGCPLLVSPTGVSYDTDRDLTGKDRTRPRQVEYQAIMRDYFSGSDAALFIRPASALGLTEETWAPIRARLPVERQIGDLRIFLPAGN